jgi:RNA polymerase sigma-70 factor (ECF subfamily)
MSDLDSHLGAIALGDVGAFGAWLAQAERPLRDSLRSFAAHLDTEAVLQEALLRIWQVAPRIVPDGRPNTLLRFGLRVARNLAVSERRRVRSAPAGPEALEQDEEHALEIPPPDPLLRARIEECHAKLPKKPARALDARLRNGGREPDELLAARLSMRTNTFVQNVARARRFMAECLKSQGILLTESTPGG